MFVVFLLFYFQDIKLFQSSTMFVVQTSNAAQAMRLLLLFFASALESDNEGSDSDGPPGLASSTSSEYLRDLRDDDSEMLGRCPQCTMLHNAAQCPQCSPTMSTMQLADDVDNAARRIRNTLPQREFFRRAGARDEIDFARRAYHGHTMDIDFARRALYGIPAYHGHAYTDGYTDVTPDLRSAIAAPRSEVIRCIFIDLNTPTPVGCAKPVKRPHCIAYAPKKGKRGKHPDVDWSDVD